MLVMNNLYGNIYFDLYSAYYFCCVFVLKDTYKRLLTIRYIDSLIVVTCTVFYFVLSYVISYVNSFVVVVV
jgi:hypothetical protein